MQFVGHVVNHDGVQVKPGKIAPTQDWTTELYKVFTALKAALTSAPILSAPGGATGSLFCIVTHKNLPSGVLKEKFNCIYNYEYYIFKKRKRRKDRKLYSYFFSFSTCPPLCLTFFVSYERWLF
jgi:hypothetical protein